MEHEARRTDTEMVRRHGLATRIWHWINAITVFVMLMSGLMIFNAHPRLYWGSYGANSDRAWLEIGSTADAGYLSIGDVVVPTTGVLGRWTDHNGIIQNRAFPGWATIPSGYSLSAARRWHLSFAWVLVIGGLAYAVASVANGHFRGDLLPSRRDLSAGTVWRDIKDHARLRFPTGAAARRYGILQKLAYTGVVFGLLPLAVLTGLTMSPAMNAAWPWLLDLFGGRASARSIHFIVAMFLAGFIVIHLLMVVLAGPYNEVRSMIIGRYRIPAKPAP